MTYRGPELAAIPMVIHRPGPDQDRAARLTVVRLMAENGHDHQTIAEVLDALALLPGQEPQRGILGVDLTGEGKPRCMPAKSRATVYIPS